MRNLTMHVTGAALCALCAFAPAVALAQASPPGAAAAGEDEARGDNARAAQLYRQGNEAFKQKRWSDAELLYLKAWALVRSFDIAANLGEVQLQLKKPRSAAAFLAFGLRTAPPSAKPEQIARMRHFLDEAKAQVGTLRVRVKNVADAEVFVDGERMADAEVKHEVYLEPGLHVLVLRRAGYEEQVVRLMAGPGVTETITQELKPKAEKAPEAMAAEANAPQVMGPMPRKAVWSSPPMVPARPEGQRMAVLIGGAATAGGAALAGVVFTVLAVTKGNDADELRDALVRESGPVACSRTSALAACSNLRDTDDSHIRWANGAILSFTAAGVIGTGTAIYWLATRPSGAHEHVRAMPIVGAHGFGLSVGGGF
ncbi:hypothetical protein [Sorangium sp. So ce1151]|uniref:hypothetical protein n=1 Tax=Sorangium sp. So ce1151 TaxID=3133332 RepID=UPI003F5DC750